MISAVFHALIYNPLYNGLVFLVDVLPSHDVGIAVVALTIIVRVVLYPLSRRAIKAQKEMKLIAPQVEALKEKYKNDRERQGREIFALYKTHDIHPFASFGLILVQLPILLALYFIFARGGLPDVQTGILYPFVHVPGVVNMEFLGFMDMAGKHNVVLALLVALSQFAYTRLSMGPRQAPDANIEASLSRDMARSFDLQARYVFPALFGVISYSVANAAPLYWLTGNLFMIAQEYLSGRRLRTTP